MILIPAGDDMEMFWNIIGFKNQYFEEKNWLFCNISVLVPFLLDP